MLQRSNTYININASADANTPLFGQCFKHTVFQERDKSHQDQIVYIVEEIILQYGRFTVQINLPIIFYRQLIFFHTNT